MLVKTAKIIASVMTIFFAALGLFQLLPFDITNPLMLTSIATLCLLRSIEYRNSRDRGGFILMIATAIFVYAAVLYTVFIG